MLVWLQMRELVRKTASFRTAVAPTPAVLQQLSSQLFYSNKDHVRWSASRSPEPWACALPHELRSVQPEVVVSPRAGGTAVGV